MESSSEGVRERGRTQVANFREKIRFRQVRESKIPEKGDGQEILINL
jgi:hypothetical protein